MYLTDFNDKDQDQQMVINGEMTKDDFVRKYSLNKPADMINHPPHYISKNGLETIDVIEAFTADLKGIEAVCTANVIKYICRWNYKNGLQDLKKAQWYLNKLIDYISENKPKEEN